MDDNIDRLNETFAAHEYLAPDPADVLEKANAIARTYCRRRTAARATGVSVLGAGLVVGAVRRSAVQVACERWWQHRPWATGVGPWACRRRDADCFPRCDRFTDRFGFAECDEHAAGLHAG